MDHGRDHFGRLQLWGVTGWELHQALVAEYAYRHRSRFDTVWWVRAEQPTTLVGDYADQASALGLPQADDQATVTQIVELLGWLPLTLEQAGADVRETPVAR